MLGNQPEFRAVLEFRESRLSVVAVSRQQYKTTFLSSLLVLGLQLEFRVVLEFKVSRYRRPESSVVSAFKRQQQAKSDFFIARAWNSTRTSSGA